MTDSSSNGGLKCFKTHCKVIIIVSSASWEKWADELNGSLVIKPAGCWKVTYEVFLVDPFFATFRTCFILKTIHKLKTTFKCKRVLLLGLLNDLFFFCSSNKCQVMEPWAPNRCKCLLHCFSGCYFVCGKGWFAELLKSAEEQVLFGSESSKFFHW